MDVHRLAYIHYSSWLVRIYLTGSHHVEFQISIGRQKVRSHSPGFREGYIPFCMCMRRLAQIPQASFTRVYICMYMCVYSRRTRLAYPNAYLTTPPKIRITKYTSLPSLSFPHASPQDSENTIVSFPCNSPPHRMFSLPAPSFQPPISYPSSLWYYTFRLGDRGKTKTRCRSLLVATIKRQKCG